MYKIEFCKEANKSLKEYKKSNKIAWRKLVKVLEEITEHPREGIGHPEPLVGGNSVTYSRHLTKGIRIVYDIYDDEVVVLIISMERHYGQK